MGIEFQLPTERPVIAKRRLRRLIATLYLVLLVLVGVFLFNAQHEIRDEMFFKYRSEAESVLNRIEEHLGELLAPEERRAFDEYSYYSVNSSDLFNNNSFRLSPLAEMPPKSQFPALVGYFQINPDGTFQSPVLPNIDRALLSPQALRISPVEYSSRRSVFDALARSVSTKRLVPLSPAAPGSSGAATAAPALEYKSSLGEERLKDAAERRSNDSRDLGSKLAGSFERESDAPIFEKATPARQDKQLQELNLDESMYQRQQQNEPRMAQNALGFAGKSVNLYQAPRKEQSWAPSVQSESIAKSIEPEQQTTPAPAQEGRIEDAIASKKEDAVKEKYKVTVTSFEAEVDPIQFMPLSDGNFVFYRKVWRERSRYIQGFVVSQSAFLSAVAQTALQNSTLSSTATLRVAYNGQVLSEFAAPQSQKHLPELVIFRSTVASPLSSLELVFTVSGMPLGPAAQLLFTLAFVMIVVLTLGLFFIYRLGAAHIELSAKKSDFVSAVSHELKTPLTSIRMYAEILREGWTTGGEQVSQYYDYIFNESERLSRLISNVLQLSKLSSNQSSLSLKRHTAEQLLNVVTSKTDSMIRAAGFTLELERPQGAADAPALMVDEDAFVQIMLNLVDNALKFSRNATEKRVVIGFRLSGGPPASRVVFFVRDFGPGVNDNQKKQIFTLFYRGESELTRSTPGTGIGLALVRELTEQMNATVDLTNRAPGAEFSVTFSCLK